MLCITILVVAWLRSLKDSLPFSEALVSFELPVSIDSCKAVIIVYVFLMNPLRGKELAWLPRHPNMKLERGGSRGKRECHRKGLSGLVDRVYNNPISIRACTRNWCMEFTSIKLHDEQSLAWKWSLSVLRPITAKRPLPSLGRLVIECYLAKVFPQRPNCFDYIYDRSHLNYIPSNHTGLMLCSSHALADLGGVIWVVSLVSPLTLIHSQISDMTILQSKSYTSVYLVPFYKLSHTPRCIW